MSDFKIGRLNHVGVAVPDIEAAIETYRTLYGATDITEPFDMPERGLKVCFVKLPNSEIELIEPLHDKTAITKFLTKNAAGGQHHICFEVPDIHEAVKEMEARGATVLGEPRIGAHGTLVIFIHPKNTHGCLIELMETPKGDH
ncbi:MAG: methylmalonyl-CoA epimerase [Henriciella sp.]|nr:methylmalonyl-CoA epimerase [Henriciella sp.]